MSAAQVDGAVGAVNGAGAPAARVARSSPSYLDVAGQLMADIAQGCYEIGQKLPTEAQLCKRFTVSRSTVRQALGEVELAGLVERRRGSGTTLVAHQPVLRYVVSVTSEVDILRYAAETVLEMTGSGHAVSLADARRLRIGDPARWLRWRVLRRETPGGIPVGLSFVYLPRQYAGAMKRLGGRCRRAIFDLVTEEYGETLTRIDQAISATVLDIEEARLLQTDAGAPAIVITRRYTGEGGLIEVSETLHPADRFSYELRLDREAAGRGWRSGAADAKLS